MVRFTGGSQDSSAPKRDDKDVEPDDDEELDADGERLAFGELLAPGFDWAGFSLGLVDKKDGNNELSFEANDSDLSDELRSDDKNENLNGESFDSDEDEEDEEDEDDDEDWDSDGMCAAVFRP